MTTMEIIFLIGAVIAAACAGLERYTRIKAKKEAAGTEASILDAFSAVAHGVDVGKQRLKDQNIKTTTLTQPIKDKAKELGVSTTLDALLKRVGANQ